MAIAQEQLAEAIESLSEGFVWFDPKGRVRLFNRKYRDLYAESADLIEIGARFEDILREGIRRGQYAGAIGREEDWLKDRIKFHRNPGAPFHQKLGNGRWLQVSERKLPDGSVVGIRADISWPKEMEEELKRTERLVTLGEVTATVSHELRNPLGAMRTSIDAILKLVPQELSMVRRAARVIDRSVTRCDKIVADLLDFTRLKELDLELVDIDQCLDELITAYNFPDGIEVRKSLNSKIELPIDVERMRRVLLNLLDNACHALGSVPGERPAPKNRILSISSHSSAGHLEISVEDTGGGIPEDTLDKIFVPLFTTKSFGVGLGLPLAERVVTQHGGTITVVSEVGVGTKFKLKFPRLS